MTLPQPGIMKSHRRKKVILLLLIVVTLFARVESRGQEVADRPAVYPQIGHTRGVRRLAVTPDGRRVISSSLDGKVKIWDFESGRLLHTCEVWKAGFGASQEDASLTVTPDGKRLIAGSEVWDVETGKMLVRLNSDNWMFAVTVTPDSKRVVGGIGGGGGDDRIKVWDIETGKLLQTFRGEPGRVLSLAVTPDGRRVVSGGWERTIKVWDIASGTLLQTLSGHSDHVTSLALTPDGRRIVSASRDRTIKVWEMETGNLLRTIEGHSYEVSSVAVTPDGKRIVSGSLDSSVRVWDIESGEPLQRSHDELGPVRAVAVTPDGKYVVSGDDEFSELNSYGTLKVWDIETGKLLRTVEGYIRAFRALAVTPDGKRAITGGNDGTFKVWDIETGKLLQNTQDSIERIYSLALTPDGKRAVSCGEDKKIKVWDIETGKLLRAWEANEDISSVAVTNDGQQIVSVDSKSTTLDSTVKVWDIETGRLLRTLPCSSQYSCSAAVAGGRVLVFRYPSQSERVTVDIYSGGGERLLRSLQSHKSLFYAPVISPDGRYVVFIGGSGGYLDNEVRVWDIEHAKTLQTFRGHAFLAAAFTPDSRSVVAADVGDRTIKVGDVQSGKLSRNFPVGHGDIDTIAVTPDSRRIIAGADGTLQVRDLASGNEISQLIGFADGEWLSLTPEGYYDASPQGDRYLNVRIGERVYGIDQFRSTFYKPQVVEAALRLNSSSAALNSTVGSNAPTIGDAASFAPPSIRIQTPEDGQRLDTRETLLSFFVEDRKLPLKSVRVFINGGQVAATRGWGTASDIPLKDGQKSLEWRTTVPLDAGENLIEVVAANPQSEARSSVRLTVNRGRTRVLGQGGVILPRLFILSIGVNRTSPLLTELSYAGLDAEAAILAFKQQEGRLFSEVHALSISDSPSDELRRLASVDRRIQIVSPSTRANVVDSLGFLKNASQYDVAILFVAGHAILDGDDYYFMPNDADFKQVGGAPRLRASTAIPWTEIKKTLYLPAKVLVFLDTCHSEGAIGFTGRGADPEGLVRELQEMRTVLFASSQGKEVSQERPDLKHGVFTFALLEGLGGKADTDHDGVVKMKELDTFVSRRVVELTGGAQHPITLTPDGYIDFPIFKLH